MGPQTPLEILISGAGISGSTLAYFLPRANLPVNLTILERAPAMRTTGQAIDIRGPAVQVIRKMNLEPAIRARNTGEAGIEKIGSEGSVRATFGASGNTERQNFTSEFEILRGDLAALLYDAAKDREGVQFVFGESIKAVEQKGGKVHVQFSGGMKPRTFDALIAADGQGSRVRGMVTGRSPREDLVDLGAHIAYFTIPRDEVLVPGNLGRWYTATGGRVVLVRPHPSGGIGALLGVYRKDPEFYEAQEKGVEQQKKTITDAFQGAGWETERVLAAMQTSDDFYYQEIAQVKLNRWVYDRVVLAGDTAHAPSGFTGMGTSCALLGAYTLAGEIAKHKGDFEAAFAGYEKSMRPFVENVQKLPPGVPGIVNPQSQTGVTILNEVLAFVSWSGVERLITAVQSTKGQDEKLPEYEELLTS